MKKLLILMVGGFISFAAMAKPTANTKTFEEAAFWTCTVTRTVAFTDNTQVDCAGNQIEATASSTATSTAATCGEANASAFFAAYISAASQVHGLIATIREPCDIPPPPTED